MVFVVSRTLVSLPPSAGPPLDLGLAMAAPRVSLLLFAHSMRCFAPPSATMMPFICSVVLQDPPLGDGLFAPTVTPEVGGSSTKAPRHNSEGLRECGEAAAHLMDDRKIKRARIATWPQSPEAEAAVTAALVRVGVPSLERAVAIAYDCRAST